MSRQNQRKVKTSEASCQPATFYDELGEGYELMINWTARLNRESPFFRKLFKNHGVKRVLDCACGTGRHAIEFAGWGNRVSAILRLLLDHLVPEEGQVPFEFFDPGQISSRAERHQIDGPPDLDHHVVDQGEEALRRRLELQDFAVDPLELELEPGPPLDEHQIGMDQGPLLPVLSILEPFV